MIGRVTWTDYTVDDELGVLVRLSVRMEDDSKFNGYVRGTEPYIFVPGNEEVPDKEYIQYTEGGYESLFDHELQKIVTETPQQAGGLTDNFSWTGEGDVPYYRRVAIHDGLSGYVDIPETEEEYEGLPLVHIDDIDVEPETTTIQPRVCISDIEVHVPEEDTFDEMVENGSEPINVICCYDTLEGNYTVFYYDKYNNLNLENIRPRMEEQLSGTSIESYTDAPIEVLSSDNECGMLNAFVDFVNDRGFDLISGWNFTDFDYEYIISRMETLNDQGENIHSSWLSPFSSSRFSQNKSMKIRGLPSFDMMRGFCDKLTFSNWRSKSLEYVSNEELGIGKIDDVNINEDWKNEPSKLIAYNIVDVILTVALDEANDIHNFFYDIADASAIPIYDTFYEKRLVDGYIMSRRGDDEILPSSNEVDEVDNAGGYVENAYDGRVENVGVSDLKSLYPSAMITWNLSTETLSETSEGFDDYVKVPKVPEPKDVQGSIQREDIDMEWLYASLDGEGIIPRTLKGLFKKRNYEKEQRSKVEPESSEYDKWDRKQGATKVIMNSFYGVSSSPYWRLANEYLGDAVTSTARYTLWKGKQTIEKLGYEGVYGDSITGERTVVVKTPKDKILCKPIELLWDKAEDISEGEKERGFLSGWKALSVAKNGETEWKPIEQIIRHKTEKDIVELQQSRGSSVTTKDHSYMNFIEDELVEQRPEEVSRPYRVNIPNHETVNEIDLTEYIRPFVRWENGLGRGHNTVEKKTREYKGKLFYGEQGGGSRKRAKFVRQTYSGDKLESLIRLCGAYISDGSASTDETADCGKWGLSFANEDKEWLRLLEEDYQNIFDGVNTSIIESDSSSERQVDGYSYNDETYKLQCMNKISAIVFDSLCGSTSAKKKLPDFIYNLDNFYKELLIEQLIKGDGSRKFKRYSEEYCKRNFTYTTKSQELCSGISTLLNQLDIKHFFSYRESKGTYTIRTADRYDGRDEDAKLIERESGRYVYDLSVKDNSNFVDGMGGVLLHNTDSHFIKLTKDTVEERVEELEDISSKMDSDASKILSDCGYDEEHPFLINSNLHGDEYTCMKWEAEKTISNFLQLGKKKRYAMNLEWKEGTYYNEPKISISGFENQRSDSPEVTAELQEEVIEMILTGAKFEEVSEYIQSIISEIDASNEDVNKFALPGSINKALEDYPNRQIPRASMYSNEHLGYDFGEGDDPFVYLVGETPPQHPNTDVVAFEWDEEIPEGFELDKEAIIERGIKKPIDTIINEAGWTFDEIRSGKKTKSMDFGGGNPFE